MLAMANLSGTAVASLSETVATTTTAVTESTGLTGWQLTVFTIISALVTAFLLPWLKQHAAAKKAEAKKLLAETGNEKLTARRRLIVMAEDYLLGSCAAVAEKNFPALVALIKEKGLNSTDIKYELKKWGMTVKAGTIAYFSAQGIYIVAEIGDAALDELIEIAANKVSPFPGKETATALLQDHVTDWIIDFGVEKAREKWLNSDAVPETEKDA